MNARDGENSGKKKALYQDFTKDVWVMSADSPRSKNGGGGRAVWC